MTTEPSLAIQRAIHARLIADSAVTDLVPAECIFDGGWNTEKLPAVIVGEGSINYSNQYESWHEDVFLDVHIWADDEATVDVKLIAHAVRNCLREAPWSAAGYTVHAVTVQRAKFIRDKDNKAASAVLSIDAVLQETP